MTLRQEIRRLAARESGMTTHDVPGYSITQVGTACFKLADRGELHRVKLGHRSVRYFTDPALADALSERVRSGLWSHAGDPKLTDRGGLLRAPWPDDATAAIPEGLVIQQCPPFEPRFAEQTLHGLHGGNQRGRVMKEERA